MGNETTILFLVRAPLLIAPIIGLKNGSYVAICGVTSDELSAYSRIVSVFGLLIWLLGLKP